MITNNERREVAERLRAMRKRMDGEAPPPDVMRTAFEYLTRIAYSVKLDSDGRLFERLADLIDRPTCHNVLGETDVFECSECHWSFYTENPNGGWEAPRHCIHCGAEVVE